MCEGEKDEKGNQMKWTGPDETKPHYNDHGRPASFGYDRSHRSLKELRSLCPRGGVKPDWTAAVTFIKEPAWNSIIQQVLANNLAQAYSAHCGHVRFQSKGNNDKPPFNGSTGATRRGHPGLTFVSDTL